MFVRGDAGVNAVRDLAGRKVALDATETEILAYLHRERVPVERLQLVRSDFTVDALMEGRVDALAGYETDESYPAIVRGNTASSRRVRAAWIFTAIRCLQPVQWWRGTERIEAFRAASLRGWEYALSHQEEISALIHAKYAPDLPVEKLRFEAERMMPLVRSDLRARAYARRPLAAHLWRVPGTGAYTGTRRH